jgi:hypothetical protein
MSTQIMFFYRWPVTHQQIYDKYFHGNLSLRLWSFANSGFILSLNILRLKLLNREVPK